MAPVLAFIPLITAAASVGSSIYSAVSQPSAPSAPSQQQISAQEARAAADAATAQAAALKQRRGMASTVMTSPMGAPSSSVQKSTLGA